MTKAEIGRKRMQEIFHEQPHKVKDISPEFAKYIEEFLYGDLYTRKKLTDKERELAAVACLIGQGNSGFALKAHIRAMLNVGYTKEEILELIIFLIGFIGFPATIEALLTAQYIFEKYGTD